MKGLFGTINMKILLTFVLLNLIKRFKLSMKLSQIY